MKYKLSLLIILTVAVTLFSQPAYKDSRIPQYDRLLNDIYTRGSARVIVRLEVPEYKQLIQASNTFKTGLKYDSASTVENLVADTELRAAIFSVANRVYQKLEGTDYKINHDYHTLPFIALDISHDALQALQNYKEVRTIYLDRLSRLPDVIKEPQGDPKLSRPKLRESAGIMGADVAWSLGYSGTGWYVAVIDSGILRSHEFFTGKKIIEACFSRERQCPNGKKEMTGFGAAAQHPSDYNGFDHGTHVSGIAAGSSNYRKLYGIAKDAGIMAINVFSRFSAAECDGSPCVMSWDSDQLKALEYIYSQRSKYKIGAVNVSLGTLDKYTSTCDSGYNAGMKTAIDNLRKVGIATIIASGNENHCDGVSSPACISTGIAVGATTKLDVEAGFSNWHNSMIDFMAPGQSISSSTGDSEESYSRWNGTSMAAPHVAGAFTLIRQFDSTMSVTKIVSELKKDRENFLSKCVAAYYSRRINVGDTLTRLVAIVPPADFKGTLEQNYSLLQKEYIHRLTWMANPVNASKNINIVRYRIYRNQFNSANLLKAVNSNTFEHMVRMVDTSRNVTYYITALDDQDRESSPATFTFAKQN
jgi:subtilisin family serine protease